MTDTAPLTDQQHTSHLRSRIFVILSENIPVGRVSAVTDEVIGLVQPELNRLTAEIDRLRAELADRTQFAVDRCAELERAKGHLAEALRILDDGPQWVNDRVMQHASVPAARAADVLRAALAELAAAAQPTT